MKASLKMALALSVAATSSASAEPYLSVRTGLKCSQCHINRSGGGGRNAFGSMYAQTMLPARTTTFVGRSVSDVLALGADVRFVASGTPSRSTPRTSFDLTEANVYLEARLIRRVLTLYVDETLGPSSANIREAFALVEGLPLNGYAKAGRFLLPYGFRLQDDGEFIRERTGFTYQTPDQGIEVGFEPGPLSFFAALTNGSGTSAEANSAKQLTSTVSLVTRRVRLGGSASYNSEPARRRSVFGGFAGLSAGRLTLLGEVDRVSDDFGATGEVTQVAAYAEGDLLLARGFNLKVSHGYLDPRLNLAENERVRSRLGLEVFPVQFLRIAAFYLRLQDIPQATTDLDRLLLEAHLHF